MKHVNFLKKSLMALVGLFLVSGISTVQSAVLYEFEFDGTDEAYYLFGGNFTRCSDNGEFAVGYSWMTGTAFIWTRATGKMAQITGAAYTADDELPDYTGIEAYDVSNDGIVAGVATFEGVYGTSTQKHYAPVPGYWQNGVWKQLPRIEGASLSGGGYDGAATTISADGKVIGGYLKRPTLVGSRTVQKYVPVKWVYSESLQDYELAYFEGEVFNQGFMTRSMSDDGSMIGGRMEYETGLATPGIWFPAENKLERIVAEGTTEPTLDDGYDADGEVACISPNGKYAVGTWSATDINNPEYFVWSKEDGFQSLGYGGASAVTDNGTIIGGSAYFSSLVRPAGSTELVDFSTYLFDKFGYEGNTCIPLGISEDETLIAGYNVDGDGYMYPAIFDANAESAVNKVSNDAAFKIFADGNQVKVTGDVVSIRVDVYNMAGAKVYATDRAAFELPSGYYLVTVSGATGSVTKKLWVK